MKKQSCKLLIAATGSAASLKIPILIKSLLEYSAKNKKYAFEISLIVTENAKWFLRMADLPKEVKVYDDEMVWSAWHNNGGPVLHVALPRQADIMVIAPLNVNTMAKIIKGVSDNLVTCTTRSWDRKKPLIFCPATNPIMWKHPVTSQQIATLKKWGLIEVPPVQKTLMCGDHGIGGMAKVETIVEEIIKVAHITIK